VKKSTLLLAILLSAPVFAQTESDTTSNTAIQWVKAALDGQKEQNILGSTPDGKKCGLYLTDLSSGLYYVVVGPDGAKALNDYVGIVSSKSEITDTGSRLRFHSDNSWGNDSKTNTVTIELNSAREPVLATGVSDLKTITCRMYDL
jgi:hypothetical protein